METAIAQSATAQSAENLRTEMGVSLLKKAQDIAGDQAIALIQGLPQSPSINGVGAEVDISV